MTNRKKMMKKMKKLMMFK